MLAFSAQSFAPFAFSPMAFAIEELIEELQAAHVNGGGQLRQPARRAPTRTADRATRRDPTEEEVLAQWELLELRRRAPALISGEQLPPTPPIKREHAPAPLAKAPAITPEAAPSLLASPLASRIDDEAAALVLLLAEA